MLMKYSVLKCLMARTLGVCKVRACAFIYCLLASEAVCDYVIRSLNVDHVGRAVQHCVSDVAVFLLTRTLKKYLPDYCSYVF